MLGKRIFHITFLFAAEVKTWFPLVNHCRSESLQFPVLLLKCKSIWRTDFSSHTELISSLKSMKNKVMDYSEPGTSEPGIQQITISDALIYLHTHLQKWTCEINMKCPKPHMTSSHVKCALIWDITC